MPDQKPTPLDPAVRDLLAAVLEALDIPNGQTLADQQAREGILHMRALNVVITLEQVIGPSKLPPEVAAGDLRGAVERHPVTGYTPVHAKGAGGPR
jgi:hypothetical protein